MEVSQFLSYYLEPLFINDGVVYCNGGQMIRQILSINGPKPENVSWKAKNTTTNTENEYRLSNYCTKKMY